MATPKTMYQRNKAKIDRPLLALQNQFNAARDTYNKDYTQALGEYQNRLSAYEEQSKAYEDKFSAYKQRADAYNSAVEAYNSKTPFKYRVSRLYGGDTNYWLPALVNEGWGSARAAAAQKDLLAFGIQPKNFQRSPYSTQFVNPGDGYVFEADKFYKGGEEGVLYRRGGADPGDFNETFSEQAPATPAEPDLTAAKTKFAEAETTYNREVAERKAGKLRARMRSGRTMLSGAA